MPMWYQVISIFVCVVQPGKVSFVLPKARVHPHTNMRRSLTRALFWTSLSTHVHARTHTRSVSGCRLISTISANCDVAFCALTVIITDFTDLHTLLPLFPTSLLLLTSSLFPLLVRAGAPSTASSASHTRPASCVCAWHREGEPIYQSINEPANQSGSPPLYGWSPPAPPPPPAAPVCSSEPKWRLRFVILLLLLFVHCVLNTIALNTGSHAASPPCVCVCVIPKQRSLKGSESISIKMYPTVRRLFSISRCRRRARAHRTESKWF